MKKTSNSYIKVIDFVKKVKIIIEIKRIEMSVTKTMKFNLLARFKI